MIEVLKNGYWSKSEAFLLPLTGLSKTHKYPLKTYLFWDQYSIEDHYIMLKFQWDDYNEFLNYCRRAIFPILDRNGYLVESYDFNNESVLVLSISEWAFDIELFLKGKYSKLSRMAKDKITEFHTFYDKGPKILIDISICLDPNTKYPVLENLTAMEYVAKHYGLPLADLKEGGELGGIYDKKEETLIIKKQEVEDGLQQSV